LGRALCRKTRFDCSGGTSIGWGPTRKTQVLASNDPARGVIGDGFARYIGPLRESCICLIVPNGPPIRPRREDASLASLARVQDFLSGTNRASHRADGGAVGKPHRGNGRRERPNLVNMQIDRVERPGRQGDGRWLCPDESRSGATARFIGRGEQKVTGIILQTAPQ